MAAYSPAKVASTKRRKIFDMANHSHLELEEQIIADLRNDYVQGLTLLGGEPFLNTDVCLQVVRRIRKEFGTTKDIWSWTGYTFDELLQDSEDKLELLSQIDILVDGRFELSKRDLKLQFRGSSNQRIIDVQKSLESNQVMIWEKCTDATETYEQIKTRLDIKQL